MSVLYEQEDLWKKLWRIVNFASKSHPFTGYDSITQNVLEAYSKVAECAIPKQASLVEDHFRLKAFVKRQIQKQENKMLCSSFSNSPSAFVQCQDTNANPSLLHLFNGRR